MNSWILDLFFHKNPKNEKQFNWSGNSIKLLKLYINHTIDIYQYSYTKHETRLWTRYKSWFLELLLFMVVHQLILKIVILWLLCKHKAIQNFNIIFFFTCSRGGLFWLFEEQNEFFPVCTLYLFWCRFKLADIWEPRKICLLSYLNNM